MSRLTASALCFILAFVHANLCGAQPTNFVCSSAHTGLTVQQVLQLAIDDARAKDAWVETLDCDEINPGFTLATGPIPADDEIYNSLVNATRLNLRSDSITGSIATEIGLITNLNKLFIMSRQLTSTLPKELFIGLQNLSDLVVMGPVRGTVPKEILQMTSLKYIGFQSTLMHGRVLDLLSRLPPLDRILLVNGSFSGTIPSGLSTSNIKYLEINNNRFSGTIPSNFLTTTVEVFLCDSNRFSGTIPASLFTNTIEILDGSSNRFSGTIPTEIANMHTNSWCNFGRNRLTGTMPAHTCLSPSRAGFVFPTQAPTHSPSAAPTGPTTWTPSLSPLIQTSMPTGTDEVFLALISEDEIIFIMIAMGGILLALVIAYVSIKEHHKTILKMSVTAGSQLDDDPRRPDIMLARELST